MVSITPRNIIFILDFADAWIVAILPLCYIFVAFELDRILINLPLKPVLTEASEYVHTYRSGVTTEYPCISLFKRNNRGIKNTVRV
ncbi:hypothetical protein D3C78_1555620 [compost metagenome]